MVDLEKLVVPANSSIRDVMACLDRNATGLALVLSDEGRLVATITDGDIRRGILAGMDLELPVGELLAQREATIPLTAPVGTGQTQLLHLMNETTLRHIPLVDESGRVVDVALLSDLIKDYDLPVRAVIMAGGFGTRLRPLTDDLPKPMLPVGDRPLLELTIDQLRHAGIRRVDLTTHYKGDLIAAHFGDGRDYGVEIRYVKEDTCLGTAGALSLLETSDEPLLVINGDILTEVDFRAMLHFHREQGAEMTVAVRLYEFRVPFGVVESVGPVVTRVSEKPVVRHFINAGIYLLNRELCQYVPKGEPYDMPDLINRLVEEGRVVASFPVREYWLDIGQLADYEQAQLHSQTRAKGLRR